MVRASLRILHALAGAVLLPLSFFVPHAARALPTEPVAAPHAFNEIGCAYCGSYEEGGAGKIDTAWSMEGGYAASDLFAQTDCAYCADYAKPEAGTVMSSWKPGSGYAASPVIGRKVYAGWRLW